MADTNTGTKRRLTDAEQDQLLALHLHNPEEIKSYLKPPEGIDRVGPTVVAYLQANPAVAAALKLNVPHLQDLLTQRTQLTGLEALALGLYRRARETRMEGDSDLYRAMLKVNRFAQNNEDTELEADMAALSKWVSDNHGHGATEPVTPAVVAATTPRA